MNELLEELRLTLEVMQAITTLEYHDQTQLADTFPDRCKTRQIQLDKCLKLVNQIGAQPGDPVQYAAKIDPGFSSVSIPENLVAGQAKEPAKCPSCYAPCPNCRTIPPPPAPPENRRLTPLG
ncbi:hypothetical protein [Spirosoma sp.]|uniref:hypothetical protein n=1 Tax=Spirosoma sp. TaxID=1899569 RepID=UPI0026206361|nr:hypothetical protein [Spirosoma sp.]MCX6216472.1 hypothetical protein [Spirosoma sp.]